MSSTLFPTAVLASLFACKATPPGLSPDDVHTLRSAGTADELVYRGDVFRQSVEAPRAFVYERRVGGSGDASTSSHVTLAPDGESILLHRATHTPSYELRRFEAIQSQTGVVGSVTVDGDRVELSMRSGDRHVVRHERVTAPIAVGPTLFGVALQHWDELVAGERVPIRFAVAEQARTYAFTLRRIASDDPTQTRIELRADRLLVRAAIRPMTITFDTASRKVVRYEGRVPPLLATKRGLEPFDARVEYEFVAGSYR